MGEARNNVRSPQYRGPLPELILDAHIQVRVMPNAKTLEHLRHLKEAAAGQPIQYRPSESDLDVVFVLRGSWTSPSRLSESWPQAQIDIKELERMPFADFKARAGEAFTSAQMPDFTANIKWGEEKLAAAE